MFPPHSFSWFFLLGDDVKSERILYIVALTKQTSLCVVLRSISPEREREESVTGSSCAWGPWCHQEPPPPNWRAPKAIWAKYNVHMYVYGRLAGCPGPPPPPLCTKSVRNALFNLVRCGNKKQRGWTSHHSCPSTASLFFCFVVFFNASFSLFQNQKQENFCSHLWILDQRLDILPMMRFSQTSSLQLGCWVCPSPPGWGWPVLTHRNNVTHTGEGTSCRDWAASWGSGSHHEAQGPCSDRQSVTLRQCLFKCLLLGERLTCFCFAQCLAPKQDYGPMAFVNLILPINAKVWDQT